MKTIKTPPPVFIEKINQEITFKDFVGNLLRDQKFAQTMSAVHAAVKIQQRLDAAADPLPLDDAEHKLLLGVVEAPSQGYHPAVAMELFPFMDAIKNAADS